MQQLLYRVIKGSDLTGLEMDENLRRLRGAINALEDAFTPLPAVIPTTMGGTGVNQTLVNNRVMISSSGTIIENAAISANRAIISSSIGLPIESVVTSTELSQLTGISTVQTVQDQINNKYNTPSGSPSQYIRGDGSVATFPTGLPPSGTAGGDLAGTYPNPTIGLNKVTLAKFQQISTGSILGRSSAGTGDVEVLTMLPFTLGVNNGGTGITSYTIGDLLYASGTTTLSKLPDVATGYVLASGGVGSAPSYQKVDITTMVTGVLPIVNGGTGLGSLGAAATFLGVNLAGTALEYKSINGTPNRITVTPSAGVSSIDISSAYVGQNTITTLGTVTTGVWNASTVTAPFGGTGFSTYTIGDLLYANATNSLAKLADVATGNALISGGVGVAPSWGKIGLTTHVSGILPIANGGTGSATQNFVDLTTNQTIAGIKTFSSLAIFPTTTPSVAGHVVTLSYLQTFVADQLAQVSINEQSISTNLSLSSSSASYQEITATTTSLKVIMYSTVLNKAHCIKNMGSNTFTVVKPDTTTVIATLVPGDVVYVVTQPSSTWVSINPLTGWTYNGNDIYNANSAGVAIGRTTASSGYKLDVNGIMLFENQTSSSYAGFDISNNALNGSSFYTYGTTHTQVGTLDIANTIYLGLGALVSNVWIGSNPVNIWYGNSPSETKGFTLYGANLGIGNFTNATDIKSNLHNKGSLSIQTPRALGSNDTILSSDYMVYALNAVSNTCTLPSIASVGYGKRFEIVASPTAGSTAPLVVTPNGTDRINYGTSAGSTYTMNVDYSAIVVTSANSGSYDYWIVS